MSVLKNRKMILAVCVILIFACLAGCGVHNKSPELDNPDTSVEVSTGDKDRDRIQVGMMEGEPAPPRVEKEKSYSSKKDVAEYIHEFGVLPANYITKSEAANIGWDKSKGNLWEVTDKKSIGGDAFGNREGFLPKADGRKYYECDINYNGGYRGAERIVYSNDGLIFYTGDHYESFERLY